MLQDTAVASDFANHELTPVVTHSAMSP